MLCHGEPSPQKHEGEVSKISYVSLGKIKAARKKNPIQTARVGLQLKYFHRYFTKLFKICPEKQGFPQKSL